MNAARIFGVKTFLCTAISTIPALCSEDEQKVKSNLYVRIYDNDHDVLVTFTLLTESLTTGYEWNCRRFRRSLASASGPRSVLLGLSATIIVIHCHSSVYLLIH